MNSFKEQRETIIEMQRWVDRNLSHPSKTHPLVKDLIKNLSKTRSSLEALWIKTENDKEIKNVKPF